MENKNKGGQLITIDDITFLFDDDEYRNVAENGYMPSYLYGSMFPEKEHMISYKNKLMLYRPPSMSITIG